MSEKNGKEFFPEISVVPAFVLLKPKEEGNAVLTQNINRTTIPEFITMNMFPLVTTFTQQSLGQILKPNGRVTVALFRSAADSKAHQLDADFHKLAETYKWTQYLFVISDVKGGIEEKAAKYIGVDESKIPKIYILEKKEELAKFEYSGLLTVEDIGKYIVSFKEGKVTRTVKSEAEPKVNPGPVYIQVASTFQRDVLDNTMDVFVKFYAPWCGHCKSLAPIYESLAKSLEHNKGIKFVQVDATLNEIPGHHVSSFPTLKLFVGNKKSEHAIEYDGPRTEEAMLDFLTKNTYNHIYPPKKADQKPSEEPEEEAQSGEGHSCGGNSESGQCSAS